MIFSYFSTSLYVSKSLFSPRRTPRLLNFNNEIQFKNTTYLVTINVPELSKN